ncbi:MAG: alpha/beta hydrolase [Arenicella sp.]|nr:alpha/beta hydrolase [Arenicella sp.]
MIKLLLPFLIILVLALTVIDVAEAKRVVFQNGEDSLSGHYLVPTSGKPRAVILFVHGDGPLGYDAHGYYPLIWTRLLKQGFAIFSWDKPGVGKSTGNWLAQSMKGRQKEVQSAITFIRNSYGYSGDQVGLLGFSQAGWVVPAVANNNSDVGFVVGVGFALDWLQQSWYLTRVRMENQGVHPDVIDEAYASHVKDLKFLRQEHSYDDYRKRYAHTSELMSEARYQFILRNFRVNATSDYIGLTQPILLLLGDKDLNVDILNTKEVVEKLTEGQQNIQISIIKNATHGMLNAKHFNQQTPGLSFLLRLMWQGEKAVAPEFYMVLDEWLSHTADSAVSHPSANSKRVVINGDVQKISLTDCYTIDIP